MTYQRSSRIVVNDEVLDAIAQRIAGCDFDDLGPDQRVKIYSLALQESMAEDIAEIRTWFQNSRTFDGLN